MIFYRQMITLGYLKGRKGFNSDCQTITFLCRGINFNDFVIARRYTGEIVVYE